MDVYSEDLGQRVERINSDTVRIKCVCGRVSTYTWERSVCECGHDFLLEIQKSHRSYTPDPSPIL